MQTATRSPSCRPRTTNHDKAMRRNLLFIVNPVSGIGKQQNIEDVLKKGIDSTYIDYNIEYTRHIHHGRELASEAVTRAPPEPADSTMTVQALIAATMRLRARKLLLCTVSWLV